MPIQTVAKALELSFEGEYFEALIVMKNQGIPNKVIARVLYQQHQIKSTDMSMIKQLFV